MGGDPVQHIIQVQKVERQPPKQRFILRSDSPFIFHRLDIEDSRIREMVDDLTKADYQVSGNEGGQGDGTPGDGWPRGTGTVRFLRLEYAGGDWDRNMGRGADNNFLFQFNRLTGLPVASATESRPISALRRFPAGQKPPFVYLTGSGNISLSPVDRQTLRWYCLEEGGMIFADCGSGRFNTNFRRLMREVFPEYSWIDIANDDPLYRQPFTFPNGAPPLWHHGGYRSLGLKHDGRWFVFYHPGDVGDAWKDGHSGARPDTVAAAYRLGVNVIHYAFHAYHRRHAPAGR
jgi:hypothetical protein